ncbi:MAG: sugar transferase [Paracoccaceae bacterium]
MTWGKRLFDVVFASILIVLLSPVMAWVCLRLWQKQGAPIFYAAERMKGTQQSFRLLKFRTMTVTESDQGVSGGHKASRITPIGAKLRAKRLDEFPQLWNILKGDISFVGPRPPLREYVEKFPELYAQVLRSRPGVTGLASVRFHRHEERLLARARTQSETESIYTTLCIPKKARLDMIYQRNASMCFDFLILFETVKTVFRAQNSTNRRKTEHQ